MSKYAVPCWTLHETTFLWEHVDSERKRDNLCAKCVCAEPTEGGHPEALLCIRRKLEGEQPAYMHPTDGCGQYEKKKEDHEQA